MERLSVRSDRQTQLIEITRLVEDAVASFATEAAAALVSVPHTTAGVTINENADPDVAADFETALRRLVEEDGGWRHVEGGAPNAASHIRTALMGTQVLVPLEGGRLVLGTWQGIFLVECDGPRTRTVLVTPLA
jgi:secondary thiamine-phosphate synthase enzyme